MSFSSQIKDEAARCFAPSEACQRAELVAMISACGSLSLLGGGRVSVSLSTEHAPTARKAIRLLQRCFDVKPELRASQKARLGKRMRYDLSLTGETALAVLTGCGILREDAGGQMGLQRGVPRRMLSRKECRHAFLRGAFLAAGSAGNPEKEYHLEFVLADEAFADTVLEVLHKCDLRAKMVRRKEQYVVYLKEADQIVALLALMGAHSALLMLENVRVQKELRNAVNRAVNCDNANLEKTMDASQRQLEAIEFLRDRPGLAALPSQLREIAQVRLEYPEATFTELGALLSPPISKSGVNHRLRRLVRMADGMKEASVAESGIGSNRQQEEQA